MSYISFSGEEYISLEDYIQQSIEGNVPWICFKDFADFRYLFEKNLLRSGFHIRTSNQGIVDEMYQITDDGNLEGLACRTYQGEKGIHEPEKILIGQRISAGWSVCLSGRFGINFKEMKRDVESSRVQK